MNHQYKLKTLTIIIILFAISSLSSASDTNPPVWRFQNSSTTSPLVGEIVLLSAQVMDETRLNQAILSTNETGEWKNKTGIYGSPMNIQSPIVSWARNSLWDTPANSTNAAPALADLDNDGNLDLLVGYKSGDTYAYQNTGNISSPSWSRKPAWDAPFTPSFGGYATPAVADLDNDGDYDLLVGTRENIEINGDRHSQIVVYENNGTIFSPSWSRKPAWDVIPINGMYTKPAFADLDNDGDYDLFVGFTYSEGSDPVTYAIENNGSSTSPSWSRKPEWDNTYSGYPAFADFDKDGDKDLLLTACFTFSCSSVVLENTGGLNSPVWSPKPEWSPPRVQSYRPIPTSADLDNDGDYDVLVGTQSGSSYVFENTGHRPDAWEESTFIWENPSLQVNTTVGWKIWYSDTSGNENSTDVMTFTIEKKQPVWTESAEYMVSPSGWAKVSPMDLRSVNITAAPLDPTTGRYIQGLSPLEAHIYNSSGDEMIAISLTGNGPYTGNFTLSDGIEDGVYVIKIPSYGIHGSFKVLRWACANCHNPAGLEGGWRQHFGVHPKNSAQFQSLDLLPSTFEKNTVHSHSISQSVPNTPYNCRMCHFSYSEYRCSQCHKPVQLVCKDCHADFKSLDSLNSVRYGSDVHSATVDCNGCHGSLPAVNRSVNCTTCHPLIGSNLTNIPGSIKTLSHSKNKTVACSLCHNPEHDIKSMTMDIAECRNCHPGINHNNGAQCTTCHGSDPHDVSVGGCIACHSFPDTTYFVNISLFGRHANVNKLDGSNNVSDDDCKACHFGSANGSMNMEPDAANETNTYFCQDCHTSSGRNPPQFNSLTDENLRKMPMPPGHGNNGCPTCHIAGADKPRPLTKELRYHSNGPKGFSE